MEGSGDNAWRAHTQTGCVSAVQATRNGGPTSEIRVRTDCPPKSLLAAVSRSLVETARPPSGQGGDVGETSTAPVEEAVLFGQVGECRHGRGGGAAATAVQLLSGRLFLRGETVLVSGGAPHYSESSLLAVAAAASSGRAEPPMLLGQPDRDLLACVAEDLDGACLFYGPSGLQLGGRRQTLMRRPQLLMSGRRHRLGTVARVRAALRPADKDDDELPSPTEAGGVAAAFVRNARAASVAAATATAAASASPSAPPMSRTLLLLGGRCLLMGDSVLVLSGLLHFAGVWHRVGEGARPPVQLCGTSVLRRQRRRRTADAADVAGEGDEDDNNEEATDAEAELLAASERRPLLLSNAWLYAQGGTVFWGRRPLLTGAAIAMTQDSSPVPLAQQESLLGRLPPPRCWDVPRLFLQDGRFSVGAGGLRATGGVAWLRAKKMRVGPSRSDQLTVTGALVFPQPAELQDTVSYEGRDLLYKDGLLYLDDLTPLMKGGRVCVGQQEVLLEWLSGTGEPGGAKTPNQRASDSTPSDADDADADDAGGGIGVDFGGGGTFGHYVSNETDLLTDGVCLLESGCIHLLRGRLRLPGESAIIIDQGVAHFVTGSGVPTFASAGFPPPRIVGWPLARPSEMRQWARTLDQRADRATFVDVRLSVRRGAVWLNGQVPLLKGCRLQLNGRQLSGPQLLSGGRRQLLQTPGFTGSYSVFANSNKSEALVFSLRARFADGLHFLFGP